MKKTITHLAASLASPRGSMGEDAPEDASEWSGQPGDPFIHLERTRTRPHGAEPWDHAQGDAA